MAKTDVMTFDLFAQTKVAGIVARLLLPLVAFRILSVEQATSIVMRFVKVTVMPANVKADEE